MQQVKQRSRMFAITFLNMTIAVKIRRSKIYVLLVAIAKKLEKAVYSFLLNAKNAAPRGYFTPTTRQVISNSHYEPISIMRIFDPSQQIENQQNPDFLKKSRFA